MRIRVLFSLLVLLQALTLPALARTHTSTGFYYPLMSDSFRTETGFWLNPGIGHVRPGITGSYVTDYVFHAAVDMMASAGTDVVAIADGEVKRHSPTGWGNGNIAIIIRHMKTNGDYFCSLSGHVKKSGAKQPGDIVKAGEWIGDVGVYNTGGDHLHFAIYDSDDPNCAMAEFGTVDMSQWPSGWTGQKLEKDGKSTKLENLVDPIWFITHNAPNNWISRSEVSQSSLSTPIAVTNPWFTELCIEDALDARCDIATAMLAWECIYEDLDICTPNDGLPYWHDHSTHHNGTGGGGQGNAPDPVNLQLDFDIQVPGSQEEIYAGKDYLLEGQTVRLNLVLEVEEGDAEPWMKDNKEEVETDVYVRYDDGEWMRAGRVYSRVTSLKEGDRHEEHVLLTIPEGVSVVSFYSETDTESELNETEEGDNVSRIETFEVSNLKPDYAVTDVFFSDTETGVHYRDGDTVLEDKEWYPYCEVTNIGEIDSPIDVKVSHRMDGGERDDDTLKTSEISLGESYREVVWGKWKLGDTGNRVYQCCVDSKGWLPETNEANNCKSMTLNVVPWKPDLIVSDLYLKTDTGQVVRNGSSIPEDSIVRPYCTAYNQGNRDVRNGIRLKHEVNSGTYRDDDGIDAGELRVGASKTEYMSTGFRLGDTGNRTYRCCVDYKGEESELNEGNNCKTIAFNVYPVSPRMEITDLWVDYDGKVVRDGGTGKRKKRYHPNVTFRNVGNGPMRCEAEAKYYINSDKYRDRDGIGRLGVNQSGHEYVSNDNIKLGDKGWRTCRVVIRSTCGEFSTVEKTIRFEVR